MDREVSKEQQTRHIYDGTLMRFSVRPSPKLQNRRSISRRKLAFYPVLAEIPRTNRTILRPDVPVMRPMPGRRARALIERGAIH